MYYVMSSVYMQHTVISVTSKGTVYGNVVINVACNIDDYCLIQLFITLLYCYLRSTAE